MFKVLVGRDDTRALKADQMARLAALAKSYSAAYAASTKNGNLRNRIAVADAAVQDRID